MPFEGVRWYNELMLFIALFSWWYTAGWAQLGERALGRIVGVLEFFSIVQLLKSLFAPFRQISVGSVQGPLSVKLRAWGDKQISRAIGAMVRLAVIGFGLVATAIMVLVALGLLLLWPLVPAMPFIVLFVVMGAQ